MYTRVYLIIICLMSQWFVANLALAQSWTAPRTWSTGSLVTAAQLNTDIRDNLIVLRAGGVAVTSQAIGDLLCASSTTQFARLAGVATGQVVVSGGVGVCPSYSATLPTAVQDNITRLGTVVAGSFPAANLSGTALPAAIVTSSLTTVGTITSGVWNAGAVTSSGLLTASGIGTHTIGAAGSGSVITVLSLIGSDAAAKGAYIGFTRNATASGYVGSTATFIGGVTNSLGMYAPSADGLDLYAADASGAIRFATGGTTKKFAMQRDYGLEITAGTPSVTTNVLYNVAGNLYFNGTQLQTGTTLPSGLIAMFDAACGAGWTRFVALDNAFPRGAATYGGTGGAATHGHTMGSHTHSLSSHTHTLSSHTHSGTTSGPSALEAITTGGISVATDTHTHTVTTGSPSNNTSGAPSTDTSGAPSTNSTSADSSLPPYLNVVWCKKD